jgi:hypothetical protein
MGWIIWGSIPGRRVLFSKKHPDQLCSPSSFLPNGYWRFLPPGKSSQHLKITTHLPLVPRLRQSRAILHICLYAFTVWTGTVIHFYVPEKQGFLQNKNNKAHFVNFVFIKNILKSIQN